MSEAAANAIEVVADAAALPAAGGAWLARLGDRLNPILVKEARQALKSRQFLVTFSLVLVCGWVWSLLGVALAGPTVSYTAQGQSIFIGYYLILIGALWVVVPFAAFRSLAQERDERTFELLQITNLSARQIIGGKLATAVLQTVIYLSALAPCLAFTYLLRGIDVVTIAMLILYAAAGSVLLSLVGLLLASVARARGGQVALSVLFLAGLMLSYIVWAISSFTLLQQSIRPEQEFFWGAQTVILALAVSYAALLFLAAASRMVETTGNRSTPLRWAVATHQAVLTGCFGLAWLGYAPFRADDALWLYLLLVGLHWYVAGVFLVSEPPIASQRLRRTLPQSLLARTFLSWFNPGPGTGYMFVLLGMATACGLVELAVLVPARWWPEMLPSVSASNRESLLQLMALELGYLAFYLGLGKLTVAWLRRRFELNEIVPVIVHLVLLLTGSLLPYAVQQATLGLRGVGYNGLQATNPFWTLVEISESSLPDADLVLLVVAALGASALVVHLPGILAELDESHGAAPVRVQEEDASRQAAASPPPDKTSPWDE